MTAFIGGFVAIAALALAPQVGQMSSGGEVSVRIMTDQVAVAPDGRVDLLVLIGNETDGPLSLPWIGHHSPNLSIEMVAGDKSKLVGLVPYPCDPSAAKRFHRLGPDEVIQVHIDCELPGKLMSNQASVGLRLRYSVSPRTFMVASNGRMPEAVADKRVEIVLDDQFVSESIALSIGEPVSNAAAKLNDQVRSSAVAILGDARTRFYSSVLASAPLPDGSASLKGEAIEDVHEESAKAVWKFADENQDIHWVDDFVFAYATLDAVKADEGRFKAVCDELLVLFPGSTGAKQVQAHRSHGASLIRPRSWD
jgi:hypothetical protein